MLYIYNYICSKYIIQLYIYIYKKRTYTHKIPHSKEPRHVFFRFVQGAQLNAHIRGRHWIHRVRLPRGRGALRNAEGAAARGDEDGEGAKEGANGNGNQDVSCQGHMI